MNSKPPKYLFVVGLTLLWNCRQPTNSTKNERPLNAAQSATTEEKFEDTSNSTVLPNSTKPDRDLSAIKSSEFSEIIENKETANQDLSVFVQGAITAVSAGMDSGEIAPISAGLSLAKKPEDETLLDPFHRELTFNKCSLEVSNTDGKVYTNYIKKALKEKREILNGSAASNRLTSINATELTTFTGQYKKLNNTWDQKQTSFCNPEHDTSDSLLLNTSDLNTNLAVTSLFSHAFESVYKDESLTQKSYSKKKKKKKKKTYTAATSEELFKRYTYSNGIKSEYIKALPTPIEIATSVPNACPIVTTPEVEEIKGTPATPAVTRACSSEDVEERTQCIDNAQTLQRCKGKYVDDESKCKIVVRTEVPATPPIPAQPAVTTPCTDSQFLAYMLSKYTAPLEGLALSPPAEQAATAAANTAAESIGIDSTNLIKIQRDITLVQEEEFYRTDTDDIDRIEKKSFIKMETAYPADTDVEAPGKTRRLPLTVTIIQSPTNIWVTKTIEKGDLLVTYYNDGDTERTAADTSRPNVVAGYVKLTFDNAQFSNIGTCRPESRKILGAFYDAAHSPMQSANASAASLTFTIELKPDSGSVVTFSDDSVQNPLNSSDSKVDIAAKTETQDDKDISLDFLLLGCSASPSNKDIERSKTKNVNIAEDGTEADIAAAELTKKLEALEKMPLDLLGSEE